MTFKIRMLTAAAVLVLPVVAGAQVNMSTGASGQVTAPQPSMDQVNRTVQQVQDEAERTARESQGTVDETVRRTEETADQTADEATVTANEAADTADVAADAAPPANANTQANAQVGANTAPPANANAQASAQVGTQAQAGPVVAATAADVTAGAAVRDAQGGEVGTIESVDADSAIVSTGTVRADIPIASFGKNGQGLVLAITRAQLEAQAQARTPTP